MPNMLLEIRGEERMEREPKQHHPVVDVTGDEIKSDAVKNNIAEEPGMLGP